MNYEIKKNKLLLRMKKKKMKNISRNIKKYIFFYLIIIFIFLFIYYLIFNKSLFSNGKNIMEQTQKYNSKISIILPTYNREKIIGDSIKSCLNQTYKNIEIIVVDDCSTDNTKEEIEKIKDIRIKYIKLSKHKGASYARNVGIKNAIGNYISFIDSDDIFLPTKLEKQLNNLIKNNSDFDFCRVEIFNEGTFLELVPNENRTKEIKNGNIYNEMLTNGNFISTQAILVKKSYIEKYLFDEDMPRLQDYELLIRMLPEVKASYTNETLAYSYIQSDSIYNDRYKIIRACYKLLNKNYSLNIEQKTNFTKYLKKVIFNNKARMYFNKNRFNNTRIRRNILHRYHRFNLYFHNNFHF